MKFNYLLAFFLFTLSRAGSPQLIASFQIGDQDLSSFKENGLYVVTYSDLMAIWKANGFAQEYNSIPIQKLTLLTSEVDTLATNPPLKERHPWGARGLFPVGLEIRDHSLGGTGSANQTFDEGDSLIFYGQGTSRWLEVNPKDPQSSFLPYAFISSPYSFTRSYYLGLSDDPSWIKRPISLSSPSASSYSLAGLQLRRYEKDSLLRDLYFRVHENKTYEDQESGREFFWKWAEPTLNKWSWNSLEQGNPNLGSFNSVDHTQVWIQLSFFPDRQRDGNYTYEEYYKGLILGSLPEATKYRSMKPVFEGNGQKWQFVPGRDSLVVGQGGFLGIWNGLRSSANQFKVLVDSSINAKEMRFDGITMGWRAKYELGTEPLFLWREAGATNVVGFEVTGAGNQVALRLQKGEWFGESLNATGSKWSDSVAFERSWVLVPIQSFLRPKITAIMNLPAKVVVDLATGTQGNGQAMNPQNMVICPEQFLSECQLYKDYRETQSPSPIQVAVIQAEDIYRHYNAGEATAESIRDFIQFAKRSWASQLRSITLIGDGQVDQRGVTATNRNAILPVFSRNDMSSEQFFGMLDSGEVISDLGPKTGVYTLDLTVGRIPIHKGSQLAEYIQKIKAFESSTRGAWQQKITLLADDFRQGSTYDRVYYHTSQSEGLSNIIKSVAPWIQQQKIYLAEYTPDQSWKKYAANRDLVRALTEGRFFVNYFGHGGAEVLSDEGLFDKSTVRNLGNNSVNSIFSAFSCLVGRFDSPTISALMEDFILKSPNGALGTISAVRESWSGQNEALAKEFYRQMFDPSISTLGGALLAAKTKLGTGSFSQGLTSRQGLNLERYSLLGDPEILLPKIVGQTQFDNFPDTIQALMPIQVKGQTPGIQNGMIAIRIQEQAVAKHWEENDIPGEKTPMSVSMDGSFEGKNIFNEMIPIVNGQFSASLITPRKLSFGDSSARLLSYAWSTKDHQVVVSDRKNLRLHGTSSYADSIQDSLVPEITAFPCRAVGRTPYSNELTLNLPACLEIEVQDNLALDFSDAVDEGIQVDWQGIGSPWHPNYIEQTGKKAVFRVTLENAAENERILGVNALDILGNRARKEWKIHFTRDEPGLLSDVYTEPNPMKSSTRFHFKVAGQDLARFNIRIFDQTGKLVRLLKNVSPGISTWDGRDEWGNLMANGLYYYKVYSVVSVSSTQMGAPQEKVYTKLQRLVISR